MIDSPPRALGLVLLAAALAASAEPRRGFAIEITEPADQSIVFGRSRIAATVKVDEPALVDRVEFQVGDEVVFVDREPPYECTYDFGEASRTWVIRAVAYHREEVTVEDSVVTRKIPFVTVERVNRVILWITATDREGGIVTELGRDQLRLFEEGAQQEVLEFYREDRPLTLAILLDSSASMSDKLKEVHAAAAAFVDTLRPEDRALVIDFDDKVFLLQELTSDHGPLKEAIESTEAIGGTALYDVLHAAYRKVGTIEGRKAIILLSDGEDTASQFGFDRVLEEARASDSIIYAIGLGGAGGPPRKSVLRDFSEATGGRAFFVAKADELGEVYRQIAEELRAQYYVAYSTANSVWDGRWIKLRVESTDRELKLRSRSGYFAVRHGAGRSAGGTGSSGGISSSGEGR